jgi:hypothetical protein
VRHNWKEALNFPGAWDMLNMRRLMQSRPFMDRIPFQKLITNENVAENDFIIATKGINYAFVYIPTGLVTKINLDKLGWNQSVVWWFNPRTGEANKLREIVNHGIQEFKPEKVGRGNDMVLVFDNKGLNFSIPGK